MDVRNIAVQGNEVIHEMANTIKDISESRQQVVDIISVIDGIAFQTNILALNAPVEAARAGDQVVDLRWWSERFRGLSSVPEMLRRRLKI